MNIVLQAPTHLNFWVSIDQYTRVGKEIKHPLTNGYVVCRPNSYPLRPVTASPGLKPKEEVCEERMLRRSQTGRVWYKLQSQQMQRRRDWGLYHATDSSKDAVNAIGDAVCECRHESN